MKRIVYSSVGEAVSFPSGSRLRLALPQAQMRWIKRILDLSVEEAGSFPANASRRLALPKCSKPEARATLGIEIVNFYQPNACRVV